MYDINLNSQVLLQNNECKVKPLHNLLFQYTCDIKELVQAIKLCIR